MSAVVKTVAVVAAGGVAVNEQIAAKRQARALLASVDALKRRQDVKNATMDARFAQLDLDRYSDPSVLMATGGGAAARAELDKYRALLVERDRLTADSVQERHALFASLPAGNTRDAALRGEVQAAAREREVNGTLSTAQMANTAAMLALVDWVGIHRSHLQVRDGTLLASTQQELDEMRGLNDRVNGTNRAVGAAIEQLNTMMTQSAQRMQQVHRDADQ